MLTKEFLEQELEEWEGKYEESCKKVYPPDESVPDGDWGEMNEWMGYCSGRVESIKSLLKLI